MQIAKFLQRYSLGEVFRTINLRNFAPLNL